MHIFNLCSVILHFYFYILQEFVWGLDFGIWNLGDEIATPLARNDMKDYRTFPLASEANMPPKQSAAKMMKDVFILCWKNE